MAEDYAIKTFLSCRIPCPMKGHNKESLQSGFYPECP